MSISIGNTKIGSIPNVSLIPIRDCPEACKYCQSECYAIKSWRQYPTTRASWSKNSRLAHDEPDAYFGMIRTYLKRNQPPLFRWHVAGDILSISYYMSMCEIAREFPAVAFLAFTTTSFPSRVNPPGNLSIVYSVFPGQPLDPAMDRYPRAWAQDKAGSETRIPSDAILCSGTCDSCGMCWSLSSIKRDVWFNMH